MGSVFRIFRGVFIFLIVSILLVTIGGYFARIALAERFIANALEKRGFQEVTVTITQLDQTGIFIDTIVANPGVTVKNLEATWTVDTLRAGYVKALGIKAARLPITGSINRPVIAGISLDSFAPGNSSRGSSSFFMEILSLESLTLDVNLTTGPVRSKAMIEASGAYDFAKGGMFKSVLTSDSIIFEETELSEVLASYELMLHDSGIAEGTFSHEAILTAEGLNYGALTLAGTMKNDEWQAAFKDIKTANLSGTLIGQATALPVSSVDTLEGVLDILADQSVDTLGVNFQSEYEYSDQSIMLRSNNDKAVEITTNTGMTVQLQSMGSEPFAIIQFPFIADESILNFLSSQGQLTLGGTSLTPATVLFSAAREEDTIALDIQADTGSFRYNDIHMASSELAFVGDVTPTHIVGDLKLSGGAAGLKTHNARLKNLTGKGDFAISLDRAARELFLVLDDNCLNFAAPVATLVTGTFRLQNAKICKQKDDPYFVKLNYSDFENIQATSSIVFSAGSFSAEYGESKLSGRPPNSSVDIQINGHRLDSQASFSNGSVTLDNQLKLSAIKARSEIGYLDGILSLKADLQNAKLQDLSKPARLSPMMFNGAVTILNDQASFKGGLYTNSGVELAQSEGTYHLGNAKGKAEVDFGILTFLPDGLQPDNISPALKGFMENADGRVSGKVRLTFLEDRVEAAADFDIIDTTFNGPTLAVTQTKGLNGKASFSSLVPIKTKGMQQATIDLVDMDALQLENGIIRYQASGNETIQIEKAEWDWFEGKVGIYDEVIPLGSAGASSLTLRVSDIDLGKLLADFDVKGLSGEGKITGTLPVTFEDGEARFVNGELRTVGTGVVRFESAVTDGAADNTGEAGKIAFEALKEFRFDRLTTTINGPLSGDVDVQIKMEGSNKNVVSGAGIKYNVSITAPLSGLIDQARASEKAKSDILRQFEEKYGIEVLEKKTVITPK